MSLINDALRKANKTQKRRAPQGPMGAPVQTVESLKRPGSRLTGVVGSLAALMMLGVAIWAFAIWWKARNAQPLAEGAGGDQPVQMAAAKGAPETDSMNPAEAGNPEPDIEARTPKPESVKKDAATEGKPVADAVVESVPAEPARMETPTALKTPMRTASAATPPSAEPPPSVVAAKPPVAAPSPPVAVAESGAGDFEAVAVAKAREPVVPYSAPTPSARRDSGKAGAGPRRDPDFVNLGAAKPEPEAEEFPELSLQGIFFRLKNPSVMINRRALYVGDEIGGAKVVEIRRRTVTLEMNGERRTLSMGGL